MEEVWKDVVGFKGYQVSNLGRVKSLNYKGTGREQILFQVKNKSGYMQTMLCHNGKPISCRVHRLVALAHVPNPNNLSEVNHIDENKQNNRADNLEWCDRLYNTRYGTGIQRARAQLAKPVEQLTMDGVFVRRWESTREAERNGYNSSAICACCKGKKRSYKGFHWRYAY